MTTTGTPTTGRPTAGTPTDVRTEPRYAWCRRGRHRRPRPRKVLLVTGGLALAAAGALSLVRLLPEPGGDASGGFGAGAAPRVEGGGTASDRATAPAAGATDGGPPGASPSATSAMGGLSGSPEPGLIPGLVPGPSASGPAVPLPTTTTVPGTPDASDGRRPGERAQEEGEERERAGDAGDRARTPAPGTAQPSRSDGPGPHPTPAPPGRSTPPTSDPAPEPDDPGLCVPVIGLCVDLFDG
ncbi:hypothetical protein ABS735_16015 [Streptomyces sp. MMCC 100]|uniref:hypothetical protein n=1 Tax=Streptomyces sp. MMCC 100 TaxID=3163555 RepID=UPI00359C0D22